VGDLRLPKVFIEFSYYRMKKRIVRRPSKNLKKEINENLDEAFSFPDIRVVLLLLLGTCRLVVSIQRRSREPTMREGI
jgi:hypothetical protein